MAETPFRLPNRRMSTLQGTDELVEDRFHGDSRPTAARPPLCVDLDGTLIKSDLLLESILLLIKQRPWFLFHILWWGLQGRSFLKRKLAAKAPICIDKLPYRQEILDFVRSEHESGRKTLLVTASDQALADSVAAHLGVFDGVYGSGGAVNLKGSAKAGFLVGMLGKDNFDYVGDSYADLAVWRVAQAAYVVGSPRLAKRVSRNVQLARFFEVPQPSIGTWLRSIRLLHWTKNLLILLPALFAHSSAWLVWRDSVLGLVLFGGCASGLYVLNDLLDLHSDRFHPLKSKRPLAAGEFPLWAGMLESASLVGCSLAVSALVDLRFAATLLGYAVLTVAYSWKLKRLPLLDVFILSSFYTIRIWAGSLISGIPVSDWLMAFSLFFFLSLAMAKRHSELQRAGKLVEQADWGRGYVMQDRDLLAMFGVASSFAAVVILCLYARSPVVSSLYGSSTELLWLCPLVLYWLTRVWLLAGRGELDHDPVMFAVRDRTSWILAGLSVAVLRIGGFHTR